MRYDKRIREGDLPGNSGIPKVLTAKPGGEDVAVFPEKMVKQMVCPKGRGGGEKSHILAACSRRKHIAANIIGFGLLLVLGAVFLAGCGNGDSGSSESEKYTPHDAIKLVGEAASESYLKISSTIEGEAAVSVTEGGCLALHDATIWKIGDEASSLPDGRGGVRGGQPPGARGPEQLSEAGGPQQLPGPPENANPGPGATHAGVYAGSRGTISLSNVSIETDVWEGQGLYASGEGSSITLVNGTITTDGRSAYGVFATHKGAVAVENVTIITRGEHSSALATFRGNGTVTAVGGTYTAFGKYSSGIFSAGDISVSGVICKSVLDRAAVLEGGSRITLKDSILWSQEKGGVLICQSFSGDVLVGPSRFEMTGGSVSSDDGPLFYVTNTAGLIFLKQVDLHASSGILLEALKGEWRSDLVWHKPVQGGTVTLVAENQILSGDIIVDEFSSVIATLKNGTTLTGAVNTDDQGKDVRLTLDATSTWRVTADSHITSLTFYDGVSDAGITNITGNGHTVFYDEAASPALGGKTYDLPKGGKLMPK